jgi:hypothetical protein
MSIFNIKELGGKGGQKADATTADTGLIPRTAVLGMYNRSLSTLLTASEPRSNGACLHASSGGCSVLPFSRLITTTTISLSEWRRSNQRGVFEVQAGI